MSVNVNLSKLLILINWSKMEILKHLPIEAVLFLVCDKIGNVKKIYIILKLKQL